MDKVLLIIPPHAGRACYDFPLGVGYVANQIQKAGFIPEILDIHALQLTRDQVLDRLEKASCRLFGISAFSTQYGYYEWLAAEIKKIDGRNFIMAGGPLPTHQYELVLNHTPTDVCVMGEGDVTVRDLLNSMDNLRVVGGVAFRDGPDIVVTQPNRPIDLDTLDFHPYHLFPEEIYFKNLGAGINIASTRGCPFHCNFCSKTTDGLRHRSIHHLEAELWHLKKKYNLRGVQFADELAITSRRRGYEICDMMRRLGLNWGGQARVDMVDLKLLRHMRRCGCTSLGGGVESGSQKILDNMNKGTNVRQNIEYMKNCRKVGIMPWVQFIFGYPGESEQTIQEHIDMFGKARYCPPRPDFVGQFAMSSIATPLPGSDLYKQCQARGEIRNERDYTLKLARGYYVSEPKDIILNMTPWSDAELIEKKNQMEQAIWDQFRKWENKLPVRALRLIDGIKRDLVDFVTGYGIPLAPWGPKTLFKSLYKRIKKFLSPLGPVDVIPENRY